MNAAIKFLAAVVLCFTISGSTILVCASDVSAESISEDEMELLCKCVETEAGNQKPEGRQAVAEVVLNRVNDSGTS